MSRTVYICINGIETNPSDQRGWTDEFVTELNIRTPDGTQAEKFEYHTKALTRFLRQRERANELVRRINKYLGRSYRVVLIGHSNGCALIAMALDLGVRVDCIHLFSPAAFEKDFEAAIQDRLVRRMHIYGSPDDMALKGASLTSKFLRLFGLGYGSMGLRGAEFAKQFPGIVFDHSMPGYGHSTWFKAGKYLEATLALLLNNDAGDMLPIP